MMTTPRVIPYFNWRGKKTSVVATIDTVDAFAITGDIQYGHGVPIPFVAAHDHRSFQVGVGGHRFYFKDQGK